MPYKITFTESEILALLQDEKFAADVKALVREEAQRINHHVGEMEALMKSQPAFNVMDCAEYRELRQVSTILNQDAEDIVHLLTDRNQRAAAVYIIDMVLAGERLLKVLNAVFLTIANIAIDVYGMHRTSGKPDAQIEEERSHMIHHQLRGYCMEIMSAAYLLGRYVNEAAKNASLVGSK